MHIMHQIHGIGKFTGTRSTRWKIEKTRKWEKGTLLRKNLYSVYKKPNEMWFTVYQTLFHILFIFSLPQHEYLYMKVCIPSLLDLSCLWNGFTLGLRCLCWQIFIWFHALPHPPTLRFNNPTDTELFNSGILHSWFSSHMVGVHGWVCLYLCVYGGRWVAVCLGASE